jgi:hypothetical protein
MRVTKKLLEDKVETLNKKLGNTASGPLELDHAACYGGYCLKDYNGSHHVTPRMSGKEMLSYLNGAIDWV